MRPMGYMTRQFALAACAIYRKLPIADVNEIIDVIEPLEKYAVNYDMEAIRRLHICYIASYPRCQTIIDMLHDIIRHQAYNCTLSLYERLDSYGFVTTIPYHQFIGDYFGEPAKPATPSKQARELAKYICESGDYVQTLILSDMIEEEGWPCEKLLSHLRKQGMGRGWWSLDLVAGY